MKATSPAFTFVELDESHAPSLLDFELANRAFFESLITPRKEQFYSQSGILEHIQMMAKREISEGSKSFILTDGKHIVARANIKHADDLGVGEIGYRVAQSCAGQGLGSQCVQHLISASRLLGLKQLLAYVMANNPASERVLRKNGFVQTLCLPNQYTFRGDVLHGMKYQRSLL